MTLGFAKMEKTAAAEASRFETIYAEHAHPIYYLALRMLGNQARAEDATHDVFLKAFRKLDSFRGQSGVRTWLYRIAVNHCQNLLQSWHHRKIFACGNEHLYEQTPDGADHPLRALENEELGERIQRTLDALPEDYRLLLLLIADKDLSYDEAASLTGQSADSVRGKLYRARKAFAAAFNQTA
ncbi:MAG: RNA polymerase sigma factor [Verrucomicrobiae bacterium]|nr:RNA polymerase sigma factor [Verrucomicrobiae bacterium]